MVVSRKWISILIAMSLVASCKKKNKDDESDEMGGEGIPKDGVFSGDTPTEDLLGLSGQVDMNTGHVTHVVAFDADSGNTSYTAVAKDGKFALNIEKGKPWVVTFANDEEQGTEMIVSRLTIDDLDTLLLGDKADAIALGIIDVSESTASLNDTGLDDVLDAIGMNKKVYNVYGTMDNIASRYSNPDVDNNGEIDAIEEKTFMLDLWSSMTPTLKDGSVYPSSSLWGNFMPNDITFPFWGSEANAQIPRDVLDDSSPAEHSWTYTADVNANYGHCNRPDGVLPAGETCDMSHYDTFDKSEKVFSFPNELQYFPAAEYRLDTAGQIFTWLADAPNYSDGEGFLALFVRIDQDPLDGTSYSLSYKWQRKGSNGVFAPVTTEVVEALVKGDKKGNGANVLLAGGDSPDYYGAVHVKIPRKASGKINFRKSLEAKDGMVKVTGDQLNDELVKDGTAFQMWGYSVDIKWEDIFGYEFDMKVNM